MPVYCYTTKDGTTVERFYPSNKYPRRIRVDGKVAHLDIAAAHRGDSAQKAGHHGYPYASNVWFAVPSAQPEWQKHFRERGIKDVEYNSKGQLMVKSAAHRRQLIKASGMREMNSYL